MKKLILLLAFVGINLAFVGINANANIFDDIGHFAKCTATNITGEKLKECGQD